MPHVTSAADIRAIVEPLGGIQSGEPGAWQVGDAKVVTEPNPRHPFRVAVSCYRDGGPLAWWATFHHGAPDHLVRQAITTASGRVA